MPKPFYARKYTWKDAALRIGEEFVNHGPQGYYKMTAEQWIDWALREVALYKEAVANMVIKAGKKQCPK